MPAQATDFIVNTTSAGTGSPIAANGNVFNYTATTGKETLSVKATAWSLELDGSLKTAQLASFGTNGLGVYQQDERRDGAYHQIDNRNGWEFVVLQFSQDVTLLSGVLNAYQLVDRNYTDNDAYLGWNKLTGAWDQNLTATSLANIGQSIKSINTNGQGASTPNQTFNLASSAVGNIWVIGGSVDGPDGLNDAFKLAQLTVRTVSAVPEPATWAMMLVGFGMVAGAARYRRRKTGAVFA
ncbi:PEP-CTERM sorting domain-containing protein [Sphingomonas sp. BT553]|uniref:PEP-CTERM sorting domain-containing protein n=2 Tax=Sphingomonas mollis TaxID=2795726 RepID=A0ABS0XR04_9SPHN|nr:PEP-CTERM sorting domain-containing protein [Sphingomonas sp. BT553]